MTHFWVLDHASNVMTVKIQGGLCRASTVAVEAYNLFFRVSQLTVINHIGMTISCEDVEL